MLLTQSKIRSLLYGKKGYAIIVIIGLISLHLCGPQCVFATEEQPSDQLINNADKLKIKKLEKEIQKLKAEIRALEINNNNFEVLMKRITTPLSAASGIAASLIALFIFFLGRKVSCN